MNVSQVPSESDNLGGICHQRPFVSTCDASIDTSSGATNSDKASIQVPHSGEGLMYMDTVSMDAEGTSPNSNTVCNIDDNMGGLSPKKVKKYVQMSLSAFSFSRAKKRKH